jgi:phage tail sheath protein FI
MPLSLTYPGVYIEEVPSGVRTIVGVATSITAFIGRARWGPVNTPTPVFGYDQFARQFGGVWAPSTLGYAVRDFFLNGGGQAVIVRVAGEGATTASVSVGPLQLEAASPGRWGTNLRVTIDHDDADSIADLAKALGVGADSLFNLTVRLAVPGGPTEQFHNLSVGPNTRNVTKVLEAESALLRVPKGMLPAEPAPHVSKDKLSVLEDALNEARKKFQEGGDKAAVTAAETKLRDEVDKTGALVNDGEALTAKDLIGDDHLAAHEGLYALDGVDVFNLLCIPPHQKMNGDLEPGLVSTALAYCGSRRAILLIDPRDGWEQLNEPRLWLDTFDGPKANAAVYFPRLRRPDTEKGGAVADFAPCGAVAGVLARTDATRGVWKAGAGLDATLVGAPDLAVRLSDGENGKLNPLGINCLRSFPVVGRVVWGARTGAGADALASEWKYLPIRRLALFVEESLYRGTQWVVFEPNDEPLWAQVRLNVGSFMHELFRQGAFQGRSPQEAYFVRCDKDTTTEADRNRGIVNIAVGFAPLKPAEFVVIRLQQMAGQIEV